MKQTSYIPNQFARDAFGLAAEYVVEGHVGVNTLLKQALGDKAYRKYFIPQEMQGPCGEVMIALNKRETNPALKVRASIGRFAQFHRN